MKTTEHENKVEQVSKNASKITKKSTASLEKKSNDAADQFYAWLKKIFYHTKKQLFWKLIIIGLILLLFAFDFISKALVRNLNLDQIYQFIPNFLRVIPTHNPGIAFSFLSNQSFALVLVITIISLLVFALILLFVKRPAYIVATALVFLGGLANFIDRLAYGYVLDFLNFPFWPLFNAFNFADVMVYCGLITFIISIAIIELIIPFVKHQRKKKQTTSKK